MSIILAVVTMALVAAALEAVKTDGTFIVSDENTGTRRFSGFQAISGDNIWWVVAAGIIMGVVHFTVPKLGMTNSWLALVFMVLLIGLQVGLLAFWRQYGGCAREAIPFVLLTILLFFVISSAAWVATMPITQTFTTSIITTVPAVVLVASLGFIAVDLLYFKGKEIDEDETSKNRDLALGRAAMAVTSAIILALLATMIAWGSLNGGTSGTREANASESAAGGWLHYFNLDVANDDDPENDFNFGPSAYTEGADAKSVDAEFRRRLKVDTALAAAITATIDAKVGTRYLGEFYDSCSGDWAKTINASKDRWSSDQQAFYKELDALFAFMDKASVSIRDCQSVSDQMYMSPFTASGDPDVIVLKTDDHSGHEIVYSFQIKGATFEVAFRLECGFQPTDVAEVMNITPTTIEELTTTTTTTTTTTDGGGDTPGGDTPTPDNPPVPGYAKDPSLAPKENTESNNDPGVGPDTNGGDWSSEEKSTNSPNYSSYDEYEKDMDNLNDTNASQRVGGDSNTPSTPSGGANVDSNADSGTGYGGVDKATEVTEPAKEAGTGDSIDSSPGEVWGGPTD